MSVTPAWIEGESVSVAVSEEHLDIELVEVSWTGCCYQPIRKLNTPSKEYKELACRRVNIAFQLSARGRFRYPVRIFGNLYSLFYVVRLCLEPVMRQSYKADYEIWANSLRGAVIFLCIVIANAPSLSSWKGQSPVFWFCFQFAILLQSVFVVSIQLMHTEAIYGYIALNQAFIYTFLPLHPFPTLVIAGIPQLAYLAAGVFVADEKVREPLIVIVLGFLQALAHGRRYQQMLRGYLEMCRNHHHRRVSEKDEAQCEALLHSMLPSSILVKLQNGQEIRPEQFDSVTVIFAEICDFSSIAQRVPATDTVIILNEVFSALDELTDKWGVHKVETVCQVYMAVAGCPVVCGNHAEIAANMALDILTCVKRITEVEAELDFQSSFVEDGDRERRRKIASIFDGAKVAIHVGLNSGPIRAGVVGIRNTRFKLFGDTVNVASRMESTCEPQRVQVSPSTHALLETSCHWSFEFEERGEIPIKGKGTMRPFYLLSSTPTSTSVDAELSANLGTVHPLSPLNQPHTPSAGSVTQSWSITSNLARHVATDRSELPAMRDMESIRCLMHMPMELSSSFTPMLRLRPGDILTSLHVLHQSMSPEPFCIGPHHSSNGSGSPSGSTLTPLSRNVSAMSLVGNRTYYSFCLKVRCLALRATTDNRVEPLTLVILDQDFPAYRESKDREWARALRFKGIIVMIVAGAWSWTDYWTYSVNEEWSRELHLSVALRNGLIVPLVTILVWLTSWRQIWQTYGELTTNVLTIVIFVLIAQSAFTVYDGDTGYFLAFLLIYLDVAAVRFKWRCALYLLMCCAYTVLLVTIGNIRSQFHEIGFYFSISLAFFLAVHGQEHFSHISDFQVRSLQYQTDHIKQIRDIQWQLLVDLVPPPIAKRLFEQNSAEIIADVYQDVTILFTDMKGFTAFSSTLDPAELAAFLNTMFSAFDEILERFGLHKVEVIGDAYFVVSGAPATDANRNRSPEEHAAFAAEAALAMVDVLANICEDDSVCIRVGLHSGSTVGGVVGRKDPRFHLFGTTVDIANRMEEYSEANRVHISSATHDRLERLAATWSKVENLFTFEDRGPMTVKPEPQPMNTYFLVRSNWGRQYRMHQRREAHKAQGHNFRAAKRAAKVSAIPSAQNTWNSD